MSLRVRLLAAWPMVLSGGGTLFLAGLAALRFATGDALGAWIVVAFAVLTVGAFVIDVRAFGKTMAEWAEVERQRQEELAKARAREEQRQREHNERMRRQAAIWN